MLKLLIVEDERWEREGLAMLLDWSVYGIELAGTADDGIDGYEKALALKPDIIITDIQMPGMNGLEMSRRIREVLPDVRIVVLTGYSEFNYAREALLLQADHYLLKPLEEEELEACIMKLADICRSERQKRRKEELHLLGDLLTGRRTEPESAVLVQAPAYASAVLVLRSEADMEAVTAALPETFLGMPCPDMRGALSIVLPLKDDQEESALELLENVTQLSTGENAAEKDILLIGMGSIVKDPAQLHASYEQAVRAAVCGRFFEREGILTHTLLEAYEKDFTSQSHDFQKRWQEHTKRIRSAVLALQEGQVRLHIGDLYRELAVYPGAGAAYISTLLGGLAAEIAQLTEEKPESPAVSRQEALGSLAALDSLGGKRAALEELAVSVLKGLDNARTHKEDHIASKVIRLIEEHYMSDEISLTMLAERVFVSPSHLGVVFKKAVGKTIHQYLLETRMKKAEEELRTTRKKVSEVASDVGMSNFSHFCLMFKQTYGMTPGNYQEMMQRR